MGQSHRTAKSKVSKWELSFLISSHNDLPGTGNGSPTPRNVDGIGRGRPTTGPVDEIRETSEIVVSIGMRIVPEAGRRRMTGDGAETGSPWRGKAGAGTEGTRQMSHDGKNGNGIVESGTSAAMRDHPCSSSRGIDSRSDGVRRAGNRVAEGAEDAAAVVGSTTIGGEIGISGGKSTNLTSFCSSSLIPSSLQRRQR